MSPQLEQAVAPQQLQLPYQKQVQFRYVVLEGSMYHCYIFRGNNQDAALQLGKFEDAIKPQIVCEYEHVGTAYLKFVVATEQDFEDAQAAITQYRLNGFKGHVYLMPIGGTESVYTMNNRTVADLSIRNGYRYSDRLQVPLFKNEWGT